MPPFVGNNFWIIPPGRSLASGRGPRSTVSARSRPATLSGGPRTPRPPWTPFEYRYLVFQSVNPVLDRSERLPAVARENDDKHDIFARLDHARPVVHPNFKYAVALGQFGGDGVHLLRSDPSYFSNARWVVRSSFGASRARTRPVNVAMAPARSASADAST